MGHQERLIHDPDILNQIMDKSEFAVFSMIDGDKPYAVPLNFAWDGEYFYAHCGKNGKKLDVLRKNPQVQLSLIPQAEFVRMSTEQACAAGMYYESVAAHGRAEIIYAETDAAAHERGLRCIADRFSPAGLPFGPEALKATVLLRVKPAEIIGKRNKGGRHEFDQR